MSCARRDSRTRATDIQGQTRSQPPRWVVRSTHPARFLSGIPIDAGGGDGYALSAKRSRAARTNPQIAQGAGKLGSAIIAFWTAIRFVFWAGVCMSGEQGAPRWSAHGRERIPRADSRGRGSSSNDYDRTACMVCEVVADRAEH